MADSTVGAVRLDVEIVPKSVEREATKAGGAIQRALGGSLQATQQTIKGMFSGLSKGAKAGAQGIEGISAEAETLTNKLENVNAQIEIQQQKLARLREQYGYLSEMNLGDSDRGLKMQDQITKTEASIIRLTQTSDKTAQALWQIDDALKETGEAGEEAAEKIVPATEEMAKGFKKAGTGATGMANTITKALKRVLRQVFILGVLYKAVRGVTEYMSKGLKANAQYARSLEAIKTNLKVAFQPIFQAVLPAINALARGLAVVTTYVASFISALFGKSYKDSFKAVQQLDAATNAMDGYGKSAKKTKQVLAGFDELNILSSPDTDVGGGGAAAPGISMPDIDTAAAEERATKLVAILQPTIDALGRLWDALKPYGEKFGQGLSWFWNEILMPFGEWLLENGIPGFLDIITGALTRMSDWAAANPAVVDTMFQLILGFLAGLWIYNTTKKIVLFIGDLVLAFKAWIATITVAGVASMMAAIALAALLGGVILLAANWGKMNGIEKTIGILGAIAIAAAAAAVAVGALQSAWSLGIAAAAIVAGTAAIAYAVSSANKRAKEGLEGLDTGSYSSGSSSGGGSRKPAPRLGGYSTFADGGLITQPTLALMGEGYKKEAVVPLENTGFMQVLKEAIAAGMAEGREGGGGDTPLEIVLKVDRTEFGRVSVKSIKGLQKQSGRDLLVGVT